MAAVLELIPKFKHQQYSHWLRNLYPAGYQKSLYVYYVDKSLLCQESAMRSKLQELLLENLNWPKVEIKIDQNRQEPEMLLVRVFQHDVPVAMVYVRNSGTEDKLALYLRGSCKFTENLDNLSKKVYEYLMIFFKNNENLMARAEKSILNSLSRETKEIIKLKDPEFDKLSIDRLLHEMYNRQKLIEKDKGIWRITSLGRKLITHSKNSE
jgi:hypothetical protein